MYLVFMYNCGMRLQEVTLFDRKETVFISSLPTGLVDMVKFMGLGELLDPQRLLCTLSHLEGKYHRTPFEEKLPFPFSSENVGDFSSTISFFIVIEQLFFSFSPH